MVLCGFQPSKCKKTHLQPQIWSIWPIFPNDSESLPKVCYIKRKNSEILSKLRNSEPVGASGLKMSLFALGRLKNHKVPHLHPNSTMFMPLDRLQLKIYAFSGKFNVCSKRLFLSWIKICRDFTLQTQIFTQKYRSWLRFYSEFLRKKLAVEASGSVIHCHDGVSASILIIHTGAKSGSYIISHSEVTDLGAKKSHFLTVTVMMVWCECW